MDYDYLFENATESDLTLDVGSKDGTIASQIPGRTISIDISFGDTSGNTEFVYADGTTLPFRSGIFDYVLCNQVAEHVPDTEGLFSEIARVLSDDGEALITFPNRLAPTSPHPPPWWYSYLPKQLGEKLAPHLLDEETAFYYQNHEAMLSPLKARWYLHQSFDSVQYCTFTSKARYLEEHLQRVSPGMALTAIYALSPILAVIERTPGIGRVLELAYSNVVYHCRHPARAITQESGE